MAGDSAGGQLAASVAVACRDTGLPLAAQLLLNPVIDASGGYADERINAVYPSRQENNERYGLTTQTMADCVEQYAPGVSDWRLSPIRADLHRVAPAVIHTAGFDILRDEGRRYAERLRESDVPVIHREFSSVNHGYFGLGGVSDAAERAAAQAAIDLRDLLNFRR